jgi:hypothetical protein
MIQRAAKLAPLCLSMLRFCLQDKVDLDTVVLTEPVNREQLENRLG